MWNPISAVKDLVSEAVKIAAPIALNALLPGSGLVLGAAKSLFGEAIGDVACSMIDKVGKELGAPKFLMDAAKLAVRSAVDQNAPGVDRDITDQVRDKVGDRIREMKQDMICCGNDIFEEYKKDFEKKCGTGGKGGSKGESFLVVLAKILGELENKQFDKVKKAGQEVSDALGGKGNTNSNENGQFDKMEALKGEAQTMSALANSVSTTLDAIFKAATTASQRVG